MSQIEKTFKYSNKGQKVSIFFFVIVVFITIIFSILNFFMGKSISNLEQQITEHRNTIETLESKEKVFIHALMKKHQNVLSQYDKQSKITQFIGHLDKLEEQYFVDFRGFQISNGDIQTKIKISTNDTGLAYKKAVRFIEEYRSNNDALLNLDFITNFTGNDTEVAFPVTFTLK